MNDGRHQPRPPSRARHRDLLAALASGFVGAVALATSTYNVYLQRQQVRAQVWPRLLMEANFNPEKGLSLTFTNRGVGPAEVKRVRVTVDGKPVEDWTTAEVMLLHQSTIKLPVGDSIEDQVLSPGTEVTTFVLDDPDEARGVFAARNRIHIEVCYCSTLGDCWVDSHPGLFATSTTRPVPACAPDPKPFQSISESTMDDLTASLLHPADAGRPDAHAP